MSIERYVEQIPADQTGAITLPLERGPGNFLLFQSSAVNVTVTLMYDGVREVFANVNGGIYVRRVKPWSNLRIDGVVGTVVTYFIGTENVDRDETDIRQQVAVLAGVSATAEQPATNFLPSAPVVCPSGAQTIVVAQNLARRRVTLSVDPTGGVVFARTTAGVNNAMVLQPGMVYQFNGTYGLSVRNDSGIVTTVYVVEES